jgi:ubiquinone/menaquinone biosynthesis C-methylase UbiE
LRWKQRIAKQLEKPTGWLGRRVAVMMTKGNAPLQDWAIAQLEVGEDQSILEVGFGSGRTLEKVAALAEQGMVYGIDYSPTMVKVASKKNRAAIQAGRMRIEQGDVANLPYAEEQFDKVISIHTLYFWPDPVHSLQQIHRVLKQDGLLILAIGPKQVMLQRPYPQESNFSLYETEEVVEMFHRAGFADVSVRPQPDGPDLCIVGIKRPPQS